MKRSKYFFEYYSSICTLLFFSLALSIKSGYSYGAVLLLIGALISIHYQKDKKKKLPNVYIPIIAIILFNFFILLLEIIQMGAGGHIIEYDRPSRYIAVIPIFIFLYYYPPKKYWVYSGIAIGAITSGITALYYAYCAPDLLPMGRVAGFMHPNAFGILAALFSLMCLFLTLHTYQKRNLILTILLLIGFIFSLIACLLSQSRGSWLSYLLTILTILLINSKIILQEKKLIILLLSVFIILLTTNHKLIEKRYIVAKNELFSYVEKNTDNTSIGLRLSMWRFALDEGNKYPLFGATRKGMIEDKILWQKEHNASPQINHYYHLHNELLDTYATRGISGIIALLLLYFLPLYFFLKYYKISNNTSHFALLGIVVILNFFYSGLADIMTTLKNSGLIIFFISIAIFLSMTINEQEKTKIIK